MKTTITCCILALSLLSCQKSAVNPAPERSLVAFKTKTLASLNSAFSFNIQQDIDIASTGLQVTSCTGEPLQVVSGTFHLDVHGAINGNNLGITQHENARDFKLVGLSSGTVYAGSATLSETFNTSLVDGKFVVADTESIQLTTPGGKNNIVLQADLHETIDAHGVFTAYVNNLRFGCR